MNVGCVNDDSASFFSHALSCPGLEDVPLDAVGICHANHIAPSIRESWH
jgi:hypothetical protein